jgi:dihydroorotate dehydrogenase (fumarate)
MELNMDLSTTYMGLKLKNPLVAAASPLSSDIDAVKGLEDAGAAAVVLESLFEEQIDSEAKEIDHFLSYGTDSFAEATSYFPPMDDYRKGPDEYLDHIRRCKSGVGIPIIASLNGVSKGGWMSYAKKMEEAGADGIELNIYFVPTNPEMMGTAVEKAYVDSLRAVKEAVKIPVAMKLGPYFSNMANVAKQLDGVGANGLVLFNRFYQPDIDLDEMKIVPDLALSTSVASRLAFRWIAILYGRIGADMAAANGVHTHEDIIKMVMAGASATQMCAALYKNGIPHVGKVLKALGTWMEEHEYASVQQMRGSFSLQNVPEPAALARANYLKILTSFS